MLSFFPLVSRNEVFLLFKVGSSSYIVNFVSSPSPLKQEKYNFCYSLSSSCVFKLFPSNNNDLPMALAPHLAIVLSFSSVCGLVFDKAMSSLPAFYSLWWGFGHHSFPLWKVTEDFCIVHFGSWALSAAWNTDDGSFIFSFGTLSQISGCCFSDPFMDSLLAHPSNAGVLQDYFSSFQFSS